ncbi:hypothetical protein GIB67_042160, partial [Kingdonia uniflora]
PWCNVAKEDSLIDVVVRKGLELYGVLDVFGISRHKREFEVARKALQAVTDLHLKLEDNFKAVHITFENATDLYMKLEVDLVNSQTAVKKLTDLKITLKVGLMNEKCSKAIKEDRCKRLRELLRQSHAWLVEVLQPHGDKLGIGAPGEVDRDIIRAEYLNLVDFNVGTSDPVEVVFSRVLDASKISSGVSKNKSTSRKYKKMS